MAEDSCNDTGVIAMAAAHATLQVLANLKHGNTCIHPNGKVEIKPRLIYTKVKLTMDTN